jgi:hypothetical protein
MCERLHSERYSKREYLFYLHILYLTDRLIQHYHCPSPSYKLLDDKIVLVIDKKSLLHRKITEYSYSIGH